MLKSTYKTLDEIPEGDRQHYKKVGDEYVLWLDDKHPVQLRNKALKNEKTEEVQAASQRAATAEAEVTRLTNAAKTQPTLPSGHVAVPAERAKLLDEIDGLAEGDSIAAKVTTIKTKLGEHTTLATENATLKKTDTLRRVADAGITKDGKTHRLKVSVLQTLDQVAGGLTYEERDVSVTKDGKTETQKAWHVKDNNKWVPLSEYSDAHWTDYSASLMATEGAATGVRLPNQAADDKTPAPDLYKKIRDSAADRAKKVQDNSIPLEQRLGQARAA